MSNENLTTDEQFQQLRKRVLQAEQERINGEDTISVAEARYRLRERVRKNDVENKFTKLRKSIDDEL